MYHFAYILLFVYVKLVHPRKQDENKFQIDTAKSYLAVVDTPQAELPQGSRHVWMQLTDAGLHNFYGCSVQGRNKWYNR